MPFPSDTILQVGAYRFYSPVTPTAYQLIFSNLVTGNCISNALMKSIITKEENDNFSDTTTQLNVTTRLQAAYNGKVLKHISETGNSEEILITNITGYSGCDTSNSSFINPDGGYFPASIFLEVTRGYNGTTITDDIFSYAIATLYLEQSSTTYEVNPQENLTIGSSITKQSTVTYNGNDNLSINSTANTKSFINQIVNEMFTINGNTVPLTHIYATLNDIFRLTGNSVYLSKTVLQVIINDFIVLRDNSSKKAFFNQVIDDTIHMFNNAMCYNYLTVFRFCNEFLILKDNNTTADLQVIGRILEVILNDFILFRDNHAIKTFFNQNVIDNVILHDISNLYRNTAIVLSDEITLNNYANTKNFFHVALMDYIRTSVLLNFNEELYEVYAINLENKALTRYDNYEFNSFSSLGNKNYGMKKDGIYDLNDNTPNAELLLSSFKTGFLNSFSDKDMQSGIDKLKEIRVAYFKIKNDGSSIMRVYKDDGEAFDYNINTAYNNGQQFRIDFGRGLASSVFQIEFDNTGSFDLYDGKIEPLILKRRVGR